MLPAKFGSISPSSFRVEDFETQPIRIKNCLWRPCFLSDRDEMNKLHKTTSHRCFLQSLVPFGQAVSEEKIFEIQPIRIKNYPCRPCFLSDRDEMNKLYKGPPIDDSCKVWFHLAKQFQRRRFLKIQPIRIKKLPMAAMFVVRSGGNEQTL